MKLTHRILATCSAGMLLVSAFVVGAGAAALPTAPGQNKLQCFSGTTDYVLYGGTQYGGTCTQISNGAKGPVVLNNTDSNVNGDYSGVYVNSSTLTGSLLGNVTQLGYTYAGITSPTPGDLSLNLPISIVGNGPTDAYAYVDAYYCPGVLGVVDIINDPVCGIWFETSEYANWSAFAAAYPTATITSDGAFVVAERTPGEAPAMWTITDLVLGKPGK